MDHDRHAVMFQCRECERFLSLQSLQFAMYDIAYGFAHTYFPLPSTERMRIEVARRGAAAVLVGSTFHTTVRCSLTPPPTPRRSTAHCTAEANGQHIQWKSRPGCCTSSLAWLGRCCLGLHSDFEFLTSRSSFSTPPALLFSFGVLHIHFTDVQCRGSYQPLPSARAKKGAHWPFIMGGLHIHQYSRVHKSWNSFFSKILEKPSIVQKKMIPHINGLLFSQR